MSFRGGRAGFGRGRGTFRARCPDKPYELFPDIQLPDRKCIPEELDLIKRSTKLQRFWRSSPYYIEEKEKKESERPDIERYSDMIKPRTKSKSDDHWQFMKRTNISFPLELIKDGRVSTRPQKKARWTQDTDMPKLDIFDKLEKGETRGENQNQGESEEDAENEEAADEEEFSDDADYNQNIDFDDDDDDFNDVDDHDDEPTY